MDYQRWRLARSQICENHAAGLDARIGRLSHGHSLFSSWQPIAAHHDFAASIEQPTMIHAAQAAGLDAAVNHIETLVRAVASNQRRTALIVAKQNQFFAEQCDRQR